jgi:hypothetical protein
MEQGYIFKMRVTCGLTLNEYSVTCVEAEYTCQVGTFAANFP